MVRFIVATTMRVPLESVTLESSFENVDGWDSLANVALVARLAEDFEIEFSDDEMERTTSVASIMKLLEEKLA
jgi:acyl carrier protein